MHIGVTLRNMGPQSSASLMAEAAIAAEASGFESLWITDHIAIPPDDAEGSGGRYVDPLTTLAWLAGQTQSIKLGTGVLILPYRPALPTAKQIAAVQELSGHRLLLGVGVGWMDAEFSALGLDRHRRGRDSDQILDAINRCFADDEVTLNGQKFLFLPRPPKPPVLIGGRAPHALERAVKYGDGWLPMASDPQRISADIARYREMTAAAGRPPGDVSVLTALPSDPGAARDIAAQYQALGVQRLISAARYDDIEGYQAQLSRWAKAIF